MESGSNMAWAEADARLSRLIIAEIESGDYLSGDHMDRFGEILRASTHFRPESAFLVGAMETVEPVQVPHIQILAAGPQSDVRAVGHWVVAYHDGTTLRIYDSLNNRSLTVYQQVFLALLFPELSTDPVFVPVQRQTNYIDCGVFAIANAASLALGLDPAEQQYIMPQMRAHLAGMLRTGQLQPFPTNNFLPIDPDTSANPLSLPYDTEFPMLPPLSQSSSDSQFSSESSIPLSTIAKNLKTPFSTATNKKKSANIPRSKDGILSLEKTTKVIPKTSSSQYDFDFPTLKSSSQNSCDSDFSSDSQLPLSTIALKKTRMSPKQNTPSANSSQSSNDSIPLATVAKKIKLSIPTPQNIVKQGRPCKSMKGRKKLDENVREKQLQDSHRKAVAQYTERNPDVHRGAVQRYSITHPEVNRGAVQRYSITHPEVHRGAVQRYEDLHREELRHRRNTPVHLRQRGLISEFSGEKLLLVKPHSLKLQSLQALNVYRCQFCRASLFEEERGRKKWCCGEGAYLTPEVPEATADFYNMPSFKERPRAYNNMFAFSALGVSHGFKNQKSGLYFLKIQGRTYHRIFDLSYTGSTNPIGLYIDDGEERRHLAEGLSLDLDVINNISNYLDEVNPFIGHFKQLSLEPSEEAHLIFQHTSRRTHGNVLGDMPRGSELSAVISTERERFVPRSVTIWKTGGSKPHTVDLFDPLYEAFQYPLLYPFGTLGWHIGLKDLKNKKCSQIKYYRRLMLSVPRFYGCGRLSEEWIVDMYCRVEEERLRFFKNLQNRHPSSRMRVAPLHEIAPPSHSEVNTHQIVNDETIQGEGEVIPGKTYLPNTFTGGPRYMKTRYMDSMAIVSRLGKPSYFLTMTCNPKWPEIVESTANGQYNLPLLCARVFQLKVLELLRDIKSGSFFGPHVYILYVIEFQKRGLPHIHICFRVEGGGPMHSTEIDKVVRADIPSAEEGDGTLRELVLAHMIHGPCGTGPGQRTTLPCWDDATRKCLKYFPKPLSEVTHVDDHGYVHLKRSHDNKGHITFRRRQIEVDDRWVVPYNAAILLKYNCHANLEIAATRNIVKYLFKYISKGPDEARVAVISEENKNDEIEQYVTKRYIGSCDAVWRLLEFDITGRDPNVEQLPVHLEGRQTVVFRHGEETEAAERSSSKLIMYFNRPPLPEFDQVTYIDFYEQYMIHSSRPITASEESIVPHPDGKHFITKRKRGKMVARMFWVGPQRGEQFYLRLLLNNFPCRGYDDLISLGGSDCTTLQEAARAMGLVNDDEEYDRVLEEAAQFMTGPSLRRLFVLLLVIGAPGAILWGKQKHHICEDFIERHPDDEARALTKGLVLIDRQLRKHGSCLSDHGLPEVTDDTTELERERGQYDLEYEAAFVSEWVPRLSSEQLEVYTHVQTLMREDVSSRSRAIFIDGPSGSGKTLLLNVLAAQVRSQGQVVLCAASSGIAALNHVNGITAHSMFRLPLDISDENVVWGLTNTSQRANLIRESKLIIYDEAPMSHKFLIQILDRSLRDLMNKNTYFGGKVIIFAGDFKQIPPVISKARSSSDIIAVSLKSSYLWEALTKFPLREAQRTRGDDKYTEFLQKLGNGFISPRTSGTGPEKQDLIAVPEVQFVTTVGHLISFVFPSEVLSDPDSCAKRALLCVHNKNMAEMNDRILEKIPGDLVHLYSADYVTEENCDELMLGPDTLHNVQASGVPDHDLKLKVGAVCMVMRNLSFTDRLVNGSKVIVTSISPRLITVRKPGDNESYVIPRIIFKLPITRDSPLEMCRRQFPLQVSYALSIHKSQGQTIECVGVDLRSDAFSHGQLYVALGRVRSADNIKVLVSPDRVHDGVAYVKNVVLPELI